MLFNWTLSLHLKPGLVPTGLRRRLTWLELDNFALVADAFTLVGLGLAERANLGGELADQLLVATLDHDVRLVWTGDFQASRNLFFEFVGKAYAQLQFFVFDRTDVAHALDFELLLVAVLDAEDHVIDHSASQSMQGAAVALVVASGDA